MSTIFWGYPEILESSDVPGVVHLNACHPSGRSHASRRFLRSITDQGHSLLFTPSGRLWDALPCSGMFWDALPFWLAIWDAIQGILGRLAFLVSPGFSAYLSDERNRKYNPSIPLGFLAFRSCFPIWDTSTFVQAIF